jgi:hypothetical protein
MPGGVGHTFTKKRFVDPYPAGGKIIKGKGGNKRIYIHATQADNKDHIDPTYEQSLRGRPDAEMKAKLYGDWSAYLGQVFDEFRDKKYPDEPENAIHVIAPFDIPDYWPRFVVGDWGYAAMTYIGFYAVSPSKKLYLYRELYWLKTKIEEWAPIVKGFINKENPRIVKFCKSAGQDRGQEHTIQEQISTALNHDIALSTNTPGSRVAGKMLLHEYLRWRTKPVIPANELAPYDNEYAMHLYRLKGELAYKSYCDLYNPPKLETNIPKFQIFLCPSENHDGHPNCCPVMIDAIKACSYDKPKGDKVVEDVAEFDGDDPYDDVRYAVDTAEQYFASAENEFARVQKQEELVHRLEVNKDWTGFFRGMERVEKDVNQFNPVRRYRH